MFITTKIKINLNTGEVLEHEGFDYDGPLDLCKGDSTANTAEQQQAQFDSQLMTMMQSQYAQQQQVYQYMKGILEPQISNPTGYTQQQLTSMRTAATDQTATQYQNAQKVLNETLSAQNGGSALPSGVSDALDAGLVSQEAQSQAGAQENITAQNAQLQQTNYWNAVNALNGQEAMLSPVSYANAATSGSGAVAGLSQAVTASSGPTAGAILGGIAGSALGAAGSALGGGSLGKIIGCWIAAAHFDGWTDPRTIIVREWLNTEFIKHYWYGKIVMWLYSKIGETVSRIPLAVRVLGPLFDLALVAATENK